MSCHSPETFLYQHCAAHWRNFAEVKKGGDGADKVAVEKIVASAQAVTDGEKIVADHGGAL